MLELIKIAEDIKNSNDIIVTAGFLSKLKNKILSLFNRGKRKEVEDMVESTSELKPKLVETYNTIRKIETAIDDLDVASYENNIADLQPKIDDLSETIKKIVALTNQPRTRGTLGSYSNLYYKSGDGRGKLYDNLNEFGKQFGVDIVYGKNIAPNRNGVKTIFMSWATAIFAGKLRDVETGSFSPGEFEEEHIDPKAFSDLQDKVPENEMIDAFYKNLPYYKISSIKPRENKIIDNENSNVKKSGEVEVFITSPWIAVPFPANNWRLKVNFVIVDNGDPRKQNNFIIYRQWVVGVKKVTDAKG